MSGVVSGEASGGGVVRRVIASSLGRRAGSVAAYGCVGASSLGRQAGSGGSEGSGGSVYIRVRLG